MWIVAAIVVFLLAALVGLVVLLLGTTGRLLTEARRTNEQIAEHIRHRDAVAEVLSSRLQTVGAGLAAEIQAAAARARPRPSSEPIAGLGRRAPNGDPEPQRPTGWPPRGRTPPATSARSSGDLSTLTDDDVTPPSGYAIGVLRDQAKGDT